MPISDKGDKLLARARPGAHKRNIGDRKIRLGTTKRVAPKLQ
jgi:hypothetical protein